MYDQRNFLFFLSKICVFNIREREQNQIFTRFKNYLKTYSKLFEDFLLKKFTNLEIATSIGHVSQRTLEECLTKCFSNAFLESNI